MTKLRFTLFSFALIVGLGLHAKIEHLLPTPKKVTTMGNTVVLTSDTKQTTAIVDALDGVTEPSLTGFASEAYRLTVDDSGVSIQALSELGVLRARQTLAQLCCESGGSYDYLTAEVTGTAELPCCDIVDWPAFKVRGLMHDIGRSFITVKELKNEIDLLARFKMNVFHWHLTDNQGFRFESKLYPQLNATGSFTRYPGYFYTQAECTEVEQYAAERGITVIPEIDMPGHSAAFQTAMGYSMASANGQKACLALIGELCAAFPKAPYIHFGADETTVTADFVKAITAEIHSHGRKAVVWNPINGLAIDPATLGIDMTEMWSTRGTKISGIPNIDCRYNYINHFDVFADLVGIYKSNVYYQQQGDDEVAGAICAIWNDRQVPGQQRIIAQNNLYANVLATVERCWKGGGKQYIEKGGTTLPNEGEEYEEFRDWERRFLYHKAHVLAGESIPYVEQTNVRWRIGLQQADGTQQDMGIATGAGIYLRHTWGGTVPAFLQNPATGQTAWAWTYVYSPVEQVVGAQIEFQNYGRSENDKAPARNCWDWKGSRVWVNDHTVEPPLWTNTGKDINSEVGLRNENFPARDPLAVRLEKGWNTVLLKLPYVAANQVRLNKWMFTFVLTDLEGRNAVPGLQYDPDHGPSLMPAPTSDEATGETYDFDINSKTGNFTSSNAGGTWHNTWTSNTTPQFTFKASANNMQFQGTTGINAYEGSAGSSNYTLTAGSDYVVRGYSFTMTGITATPVTLKVGDQTYTSTTKAQQIEVSGLSATSASFTLQGSNKGVTLSDFKVHLQARGEQSDKDKVRQYEVFQTLTTSDIPYRIPAIATAGDGTIVACADYRYSRVDIGSGRIDLYIRRSTDNGKTWEPIIKPATMRGDGDMTAGHQETGFGDPCLVGDRESNRMLLMSCSGTPGFFGGTRNHHQGWARWYSEDGGKTWGAPSYIDEEFVYAPLEKGKYGAIRGWFVGSGKITQSQFVKVGKYFRLYCVGSSYNGSQTANWALYSDDFGETWQFLGGCDKSPVPGGDEPKAEELPNGNVLLSSRCSGGRNFNIFTFTDPLKAEGSWADAHAFSGASNNGVTALGNACNGEVMLLPVVRQRDQHPTYLMLQSVPFGNGRANVGIYYKELDSPTDYDTPAHIAAGWNGAFQVSTLYSAYSTMTWQQDNSVGFLYEEETHCGTGGGGYTIVYRNLTVDEITDGAYRFDPDAHFDVVTSLLPPSALLGQRPAADANFQFDLMGRRTGRVVPGISVVQGKKYLRSRP